LGGDPLDAVFPWQQRTVVKGLVDSEFGEPGAYCLMSRRSIVCPTPPVLRAQHRGRPANQDGWTMKTLVGQAFSVLGLAAHLGRGAGRVATDAAVGGRFGLPRTVDGIDPSVLSRVMGTTVRSIRVLSRDAGTSSRGRLV